MRLNEKNVKKSIQRLDDPFVYSSRINTLKTQVESAKRKPEYLPRTLEVDQPSNSVLSDKCLSQNIWIESNFTLPST